MKSHYDEILSEILARSTLISKLSVLCNHHTHNWVDAPLQMESLIKEAVIENGFYEPSRQFTAKKQKIM